MYFLSPDDAKKLREENLSDKMNVEIKRQILKHLEELMRKNPFGQTFVTAGQLIEDGKKENDGQMPRFQVTKLRFHLLLNCIFYEDCITLGSGIK